MDEPEEMVVRIAPEQAELLDILVTLADAAREVVHAHEANRPLASRLRALAKQVTRLEGLIPGCPSS